ncbi:unnamed protein product [Caenorhabditis auriculariae]|uniref:Solute carrier family 25 member 51 n=1 Tax=Caenorhabditis auriculariae TaxID=2777116 RepID=A0A8S1H805_9PELO|nr:unnamed protein product [Caenorhabditis auriculariae]
MRTTTRALMFGLYEQFQKTLHCPHTGTFTFCHAQAAMCAGFVEASMCPLERVQVLLQTTAHHEKFRNSAEVVKQLRSHGVHEFYRGLSVILVRNGLSNLLFFGFREPLNRKLVEVTHRNDISNRFTGIVCDFVCGSLLGASISTLFYPAAVVKNHMQSKIGGPFENPFRVLKYLLVGRDRSALAIYSGVYLNFTRSMVAWGITNTIYEMLHRFASRYA